MLKLTLPYQLTIWSATFETQYIWRAQAREFPSFTTVKLVGSHRHTLSYSPLSREI